MAAKKRRTMDTELTPEIIAELIHKANRPLRLDDILAMLTLRRQAKRDVELILHALETDGRLVRSRGAWFPPKNRPLVKGILSIQRSGVGFVMPEDGSAGDIFIAPHDIKDAWDGDHVEVIIMPQRKGPNREGRITRIIERSQKNIPVLVLRKQGQEWIAEPQHPGLQALFLVDVSELEQQKTTPENTRPAQAEQSRPEHSGSAQLQADLPQPADIAQPAAQDSGLGRSGTKTALPVTASVRAGDLLIVLPVKQLSPNLWSARAIMNLHNEEKPAAQELLAKIAHGIPMEFPAAVIQEATAMPEQPAEEDITAADRKDLRHLPFVTIDGADAKDFDDAIYVEKRGTGYRLAVAIADVAHYVPEGSSIDNEARRRGNSYYFPLSVEPMLPHVLSNGLCSLKPRSPRLCVVADMVISREGMEISSTFYTAVIESKGRLIYDQVYDAIIGNNADSRQEIQEHVSMLTLAFELAALLSKIRAKRGSLDFGLPEARFVFDEKGNVSAIIAHQNTLANNLIEECMIAANEAVARFLAARNSPLLYRVHEAPSMEKLEALKNFIMQTRLVALPSSLQQAGNKQAGKGSRQGFSRKSASEPAAPSPQEFMAILEAAKGTPQEYTVNKLLLRAMMQARYSPDNEGHFGLASKCYCHFTSPIRRYADLIVHRSLKRQLRKESGGMSKHRGAEQDPYQSIALQGDPSQTVRINEKQDTGGMAQEKRGGQKKGAGRKGAGNLAQKGKKNDLKEAGLAYPVELLEDIAKHINQTERSAMDAERETQKRLSALYLQQHVGEDFDGIVSGVTDFGIFVELPSCLAEGMIRLASLHDDFYQYLPERQMLRGERTGRIFSIGQPLRVTLTDVSIQRFEVNLEPADSTVAKEPQKFKKTGKNIKRGKTGVSQGRAGNRQKNAQEQPRNRKKTGKKTDK